MRPLLEMLHAITPKADVCAVLAPAAAKPLDSEAFAALSAACVDHGTATTGFHANQEAVGTGAAGFCRLVSAFHGKSN
jgi:hypothetical protein